MHNMKMIQTFDNILTKKMMKEKAKEKSFSNHKPA